MSWTQTPQTVTLTCDGQRHTNDVVPQLTTAIRDGEHPLEATRRIWSVADPGRNLNHWTAASTEHHCPDCTRARQPGNPTADL